jgi:hypothetical protein
MSFLTFPSAGIARAQGEESDEGSTVHYIGGTVRPMVSGPPLVPVRSRGSRCGHEGCDTILSIYNPTSFCALHEPPQQAIQSRQRRSDGQEITGNCALEGCGRSYQTVNARRRYCSDRCRMAAFALRKKQEAFAIDPA